MNYEVNSDDFEWGGSLQGYINITYAELKKIYDISIRSFKVNPLYMDIDEKTFIKQYEFFKEKIYEKLFGGFEDLTLTAIEDENEIDELENIPKEKKTKQGYLKDDQIDAEYIRWLYTAITRATHELFLVNFHERFFN